MLVAAAVLPHPPLLVPALASGAGTELAGLRSACTQAVAAVAAAADVTYLVGVDTIPHATSFAPWGAAAPVDVPEPLPLSLLVGAWLTSGTPRSFVAVADELTSTGCADLGAELAGSAERVALLAMGDSTARLSEKAPGYLDERAAAYDDAVASALARGDTAALLELDEELARELLVAGRAPWQVLAGAAASFPPPAVASGWRGAPYGVGYHVVTWTWPQRT